MKPLLFILAIICAFGLGVTHPFAAPSIPHAVNPAWPVVVLSSYDARGVVRTVTVQYDPASLLYDSNVVPGKMTLTIVTDDYFCNGFGG